MNESLFCARSAPYVRRVRWSSALHVSKCFAFSCANPLIRAPFRLHKFAAEVAGELDWLAERQAAAASEATPGDLHAAQSAQKKHGKLRAELAGRKPVIEKVIAQGAALAEEGHPQGAKVGYARREWKRNTARKRAVVLCTFLTLVRSMYTIKESDIAFLFVL